MALRANCHSRILGFRRLVNAALGDRRGSIAVQAALLMVVLIAFAALGLEITMLFAQERRMQAAADAAVVSASTLGRTTSQATAEALALAGTYGFRHGQDTVAVTYTTPPSVGSYGAAASEVTIQKAFDARLLAVFSPGPITVKVRAIALQQSQSPGCLLALDPTSANAIVIRNNSAISNVSCELAANSNSNSALYVENKSDILGPIYLVGGMVRQNNTVVSGAPQTINAAAPVDDPYAKVTLPTPTGTCRSGAVSGTQALVAGHYCTGIVIANNSNLTLGAGTYFIDGSFTVGRNATITGTGGVTLLFNSAPAITIANGATIRLTAPISGDTAGMALATHRAITNAIFAVNNNATIVIEGAIYLPGWTISVSGQVNSSGAKCTQMIADRLDLASNLSLQADCAGTGVRPIGRTRPVLIQ